MAGSQAVIETRQLFHFAEFESVVRLQREIWGFPDIELLPVRFLAVASRIGGHVFGAFHGSEMAGFCFAVPGIKPEGQPYLHSHMLGVLPAWHNAGIGRQLKLRQRDDALARGLDLIEWTFDPLELKNAYFNIERLGAIVRRYRENHYGVTASPLHGSLPTDRCYAEWWIRTPRVEEHLTGGRAERKYTERISYPSEIARIRQGDPERAREIQRINGEKFQRAFAAGLAVTGFERGEAEGAYLLEPWR